MRVINHKDQPTEQWRPEVTTRMLVSAVVGSSQLCLFHHWCELGSGARTHHHAVEEVRPFSMASLKYGLTTGG